MTNVILMVLTLALGMRPRELALRQSGSFSIVIRCRFASVSGTAHKIGKELSRDIQKLATHDLLLFSVEQVVF